MTHLTGIYLLTGMWVAHSIPTGEDFSIVGQIVGADSQVTEARVLRITNPRQWQTVWNEHSSGVFSTPSRNSLAVEANAEEAPSVNFRANEVLAVLGGSSDGVQGYEVVRVDNRAADIRIRLRYLPGPALPAYNRIYSSPFGFFVVPKAKKRIVFELRVGNRWQQIADLPPVQK